MPMSKRIVRALGLSLVGALILAALCAGALILGTDGADLSYRTLDYDVTATADGDLKARSISISSCANARMTMARPNRGDRLEYSHHRKNQQHQVHGELHHA